MVTRDDVAKHAGVSVAVVSYVINNKTNVKESTRQIVLQAIEELGYKPNLTARSLKTKKMNQLGVLINHLGNPFETGFLLGLDSKARQHDQFLIFQTYYPWEEDRLKTLFMGRTDGIILLGQSLKAGTIEHFSKIGVPIYSITQPVHEHPSVQSIDINWYEAMLKLIDHLKGHGHTQIGFMADSRQDHHHHLRYLNFMKAMDDSGFYFQNNLLLQGRGTLESAYDSMRKQLSLQPQLPFSAIICANDLMAVGVLSACRDHGVLIPEQLSVATCEDILIASHTTPTLTTIHYPRPEIGYLAVDAILKHTNGEIPIDVTINSEIMIRQSTGPYRDV